jgi:hypothetical protein
MEEHAHVGAAGDEKPEHLGLVSLEREKQRRRPVRVPVVHQGRGVRGSRHCLGHSTQRPLDNERPVQLLLGGPLHIAFPQWHLVFFFFLKKLGDPDTFSIFFFFFFFFFGVCGFLIFQL